MKRHLRTFFAGMAVVGSLYFTMTQGSAETIVHTDRSHAHQQVQVQEAEQTPLPAAPRAIVPEDTPAAAVTEPPAPLLQDDAGGTVSNYYALDKAGKRDVLITVTNHASAGDLYPHANIFFKVHAISRDGMEAAVLSKEHPVRLVYEKGNVERTIAFDAVAYLGEDGGTIIYSNFTMPLSDMLSSKAVYLEVFRASNAYGRVLIPHSVVAQWAKILMADIKTETI